MTTMTTEAPAGTPMQFDCTAHEEHRGPSRYGGSSVRHTVACSGCRVLVDPPYVVEWIDASTYRILGSSYAHLTITLAPATREELGIERNPDPMLDEEASLALYDVLTLAAVHDAFPGASVEFGERGTRVWDSSKDNPEDNEYLSQVNEIAERVLSSQEWCVFLPPR